ncbi:hypothetical protein [Klebsiella oxytoca]|uniref:hypothetical protein n=1 Tax=Klebsiella oxytoca TaxID=571 RepID=UPI00190ED9C9|nr:hypothetical protein [Klebsiella oxytoca]
MYPDYVQIDMPAQYCQADATWIQEQLGQLPVAMRQKAQVRYSEVYQLAFDAEPVSYRQENRARHAANTRLRLFVGRYHTAAMGLTEKATLASTHSPAGAAAEIQPEQATEKWW